MSLSSWRQVITVEPLFAFYTIIYYYRVLSYSKSILFEAEAPLVQLVVRLIQDTIPIILAHFFGSCSDKYKARKLFLLFPFLGETLALTGLLMCTFFENQCPRIVIEISHVIPSFFGGQVVALMAALAYIADISPPKNLSFRVGIFYIVLCMSLFIYQYFINFLFHWSSLPLILVLLLICILYWAFWLQEPKQTQVYHLSLVKNMFNPKFAIETLTLLLRKFFGRNRIYVFVLLNIISLYWLSNYIGHYSLFFVNVPYSQIRQLNDYVAIQSIGALAAVPLLTSALQISDTTMLILGALSQIVSNVIIVAFTNSALLYFASFIGIFVIFSLIISQSMILKIASPDDFGKVAAMIAIFDASGNYFAEMAANYIGNHHSFAYAYVGVVVFVILLPVLVWLHIDYKKNTVEEVPRDDLNENNHLQHVENQV